MSKQGTFLRSSSSALTPNRVYNVTTGEELSQVHLQTSLTHLVELVQNQAQDLLVNHWDTLLEDCKEYKRQSPEFFVRTKPYDPPTGKYPRELKAKSRVQRLVRYNLITTALGYVRNPNPKKQAPTVGKVLNLGATDNHLATLTVKGDTLTLVFNCWDTKYLLEFTLPTYVLQRSITKWCLPTICNHHGSFVFRFPYEEAIPTPKHSTLLAGVDLGRVEPFTLAVLSPTKSGPVAQYTSTARLRGLNQKRERLLTERKHLGTKIKAYQHLGLDTGVLEWESAYKSNKVTRLGETIAHHVGNEIAKKLAKHKVAILNVEDLRWVTGSKYGGRWNHSKQQAAVEHSLLRVGTHTKRVNPKNTSQTCAGCGAPIVHDPLTRTVWCASCRARLDRDMNAAINIARTRNKNARPTDTVGSGTTVGTATTVQFQVVEQGSEQFSYARGAPLGAPTLT